MARLKSTYALQQKANEFDFYDLIDEIEEDILEEERRGYGEWQNKVCVLPNFPEVRKTLSNIKPIVKGRCWLVYDRDEITSNQQNELEGMVLYRLYYDGRFQGTRNRTLTRKEYGGRKAEA